MRRDDVSDQTFRDWFMNAPGAVCIVGLDGKLLELNDQACSLHGGRREQLIGLPMLEMISPQMRKKMAAALPLIIAGELTQMESECLRGDGDMVPVEIRIARTSYLDQPALMMHAWDISERRRVELRFRESERLLARAQEIARVGSFSRDLRTERFTASTEFYRIFGFDRKRDRIDSVEQIYSRIHPEDRDRFRAYVEKVGREGVSYPIEYRLLLENGTIRHLFGQSEVVFNHEDRPVRVIGTVQDISQRKQTEQRLRENDARLRLVYQQIPAVLWTTDDLLRIAYSEGTGLDMIGLISGEVVGKTLYEYLSTDDSEEPMIKASLAALEGESSTLEMTIEPHTFQSHIEPMRDTDGRIVGTIGIALDITDRKRDEQRQALMMQELDHRVKNNLAAVLAIFDQSMIDTGDLETFQERFTGRIIAMGRTHSFLASTHWQGASLREIIEQTIAPYTTPDHPRATIDGPPVTLNPSTAMSICIAIHELATNAIKYGALSNAAGHIHIDWQVKDQCIYLQWSESGGPPVTEPTHRGFGTRLIEKGITYQFGGEAKLDFAPGGLQYALAIPLES